MILISCLEVLPNLMIIHHIWRHIDWTRRLFSVNKLFISKRGQLFYQRSFEMCMWAAFLGQSESSNRPGFESQTKTIVLSNFKFNFLLGLNPWSFVDMQLALLCDHELKIIYDRSMPRKGCGKFEWQAYCIFTAIKKTLRLSFQLDLRTSVAP